MKDSVKVGISFGLTSGIITTLGLIVGLHSGTHSTLAVVGGIITIAIADSMSDALGIHISKEAENTFSKRQVWNATLVTFLTKFLMAGSFMVPVLLFELNTAIVISVVWGISILIVLSYFLAKSQNENPVGVIAEHVIIALAVITLTHFVGDWVAASFT